MTYEKSGKDRRQDAMKATMALLQRTPTGKIACLDNHHFLARSRKGLWTLGNDNGETYMTDEKAYKTDNHLYSSLYAKYDQWVRSGR